MIRIIFDKIVSLILLLICLPFLIIIAALVKYSSAGPIIYNQKRIGYQGVEFTIYKFRSMIDGSGKFNDYVLPGDSRVTKFGRFLRSTHLDELPQLWNIIVGDMGFVGPRPMQRFQYEFELITNPCFAKLLTVRPGLTGPVQVRGRIWEYSNKFESYKVNIEYINNRSVVKDLKIIFYTMGAVLRGQGV